MPWSPLATTYAPIAFETDGAKVIHVFQILRILYYNLTLHCCEIQEYGYRQGSYKQIPNKNKNKG